MLKVVPLMITSGLFIAANAGVFVPLLELTMQNTVKSKNWSDQVTNQHALVALSILGLGEIVGSPVFGKILDKYGHKVAIIACMTSLTLSIFAISWYVIAFRYSFWASLAICFLWGFQESGIGVFLACVMGFEFESKAIPFSVKNLVQSLTVFAALFLESLLTNKRAFLIYVLVLLGVFGLCSWVFVLATFQFKSKKTDIDKISTNHSEILQSENNTEI